MNPRRKKATDGPIDVHGDGTIDYGEQFVYDGEDVALVYDLNGDLLARYMHGPGVDQVLAADLFTSGIPSSGQTYWTLTDHLGSVIHLMDNQGVLYDENATDAYGRQLYDVNDSTDLTYAFTGREWDSDAELQYSRARWYDPRIGRFISEDPIGYAAGDTNVSRYVGNSPTNRVDPTGLFEEPPPGMGHLNFGGRGTPSEADVDAARRDVWFHGQLHRQYYTREYGDVRGGMPWENWTEAERRERYIQLAVSVENPDYLETEEPNTEELLLDLTQMALDLGGIIEPTPFADGASTVISLYRRDWLGATVGLVSMFPYLGDMAKATKVGTWLTTIGVAVTVAGKNERFAKAAKPVLRQIHGILKKVDLDRLPGPVGNPLKQIRDKLDELFSRSDAARNRASFEEYKAVLRRNMSKPHVSDPELAEQFESLYRSGAEFGSGSTADAARLELAFPGVSVKGADHVTKARREAKFLEKWLRNNPDATPGDIAAAENVLKDLLDALSTKPVQF